MKCDQNCTSCSTNCSTPCPVCGKTGMNVSYDTVSSLIKGQNVFFLDKTIHLCTTKNCNVVYFQESNPKFYNKEELKVPIWYKEKYNQYMVCYCHKIYLNDIVELVKNIDKDTLSKQEVLQLLGKDLEVEDHLHFNPTGKSCDQLFENAIEFAFKQKRGE